MLWAGKATNMGCYPRNVELRGENGRTEKALTKDGPAFPPGTLKQKESET